MKLKFPVTGKKGSYYSCCAGGSPCAAFLDYMNNLDGGSIEFTGWYFYGGGCTGCDALNGSHPITNRGAYTCPPPHSCGDPNATYTSPGTTVCLYMTPAQQPPCGQSVWGGNFYGCVPFLLNVGCNPSNGAITLGVSYQVNEPMFLSTFPQPADPSHPSGTYVLEYQHYEQMDGCFNGNAGNGAPNGTCTLILP